MMIAAILKWIVVLLSLMNTGFMAFDGARALIKGDYIRPRSGEHAGQLGPWTKLAEKLGIDPMSSLMKSIFVLYGIIGSFITACFAIGSPWAWKAMVVFNLCSLWYLFFGTVSGVLQIILLILIRVFR